MNERIREYAKQAVLTAWSTYAYGPDAIWLKEYNKKFAELIVRKCCQPFWTEKCNTSDLAYLDYKEKTNKIKQHFGVEE
jgi:hypothetical protein